MILLAFSFASELINCPTDSGKVITGIRCKNGCKSAELKCGSARIQGLTIDITGNALWARTGLFQWTSTVSCNGNTVATSIETDEDGAFRLTCSRLEKVQNSNVVPQISNANIVVLLTDGQMKICPQGYAVNGIVVYRKRLQRFQCVLIMAPSTIGPVAPVKALATVPLGGIIPSATIWDNQVINVAPGIGSASNGPHIG